MSPQGWDEMDDQDDLETEGYLPQQEDLLNSKDLCDAILNVTGAAIVVLDPFGRIVRFNQTAQEITGYSFAELQNQPIWDWLVPPERLEDVKGVFNSLLFDRMGGHFENEWLTKDGSRRLFSWRNTVLRDANGKVSNVIGIGEDITERKKAEAELLNREKQLRFVLEGSGLGFWDWNIVTGEVDRNERWATMLGYTHDEIQHTTKQWTDFIHPDDRARAWESISAVLEGRSNQHKIEYRMLHKDGGIRWILDQASVMLRADDGSPARMCGTHTDITERKQAEDDLVAAKLSAEEANAAKSRFLAAASHDLRQPLHALGMFADVLEERARDTDMLNLVEKIQHCATALESQFESLLDISKMDAGIIEAKIVHFPIAPLVQRLHAEYAPQAKAKGLQISNQCGELVVKSDPGLVERIIRNLVANAIRYTDAGEIVIRCTAVDAGVEMEVHDTGIGIPEAQHERIFEEFVQVGNPERDRSKGLGLGLSIVRRLAALLGTRVELQSAPGVGSSFYLTLPAGNPEACVNTSEMQAVSPSILANAMIAVVDDEGDVREGMRLMLENWGCRVMTAEDSANLLSAMDIAGATPDVLIVDFRLREGKTGIEAIRHIESHFGASIPSLIITGETAPERLNDANSVGYRLLHKPVQPAKLRALIQYLIRNRASTAGAGRQDL